MSLTDIVDEATCVGFIHSKFPSAADLPNRKYTTPVCGLVKAEEADERHARSELLMGKEPTQRTDLDTAVELVDMTFFAYDIQDRMYTATSAVMLIAGNTSVPVHLDTTKVSTWHIPKTYKDYLNSQQKSLWRTAKELKMDEYKAIPHSSNSSMPAGGS